MPAPRTIRLLLAVCIIACALLAACDNGAPATATPAPTPQPTTQLTLGALPAQAATPVDTPTPLPAPTGTAVDLAVATPPPTEQDDVPTPTPVTATASGEAITAMQALAALKTRALAWQQDARLAMLSNTRPGQGANLLGSAPGDANVNEATPGGKGRNWTLIAFSPSTRGAMAFSMDGSQTDLGKAGMVTNDMLSAFAEPGQSALDLAGIDPASLADSDKIAAESGQKIPAENTGITLLAPNGLGLGALPPAQSGDKSPDLAYQLFSTDAQHPYFAFYDAATGKVLMDSNTP